MTTDLMDLTELDRVPTDVLRNELANSLTMTARQLQRLAAIWQELTRRGEDLSGLRSGLALYLPLIARGQLDAAMVVRYAGQKMLLLAASRVPLAQQQQLLETNSVTVVRRTDDGGFVEAETPLHQLAALDVRHVFGDDGVRTPGEQRRLLSAVPPRKRRGTNSKRSAFRKARRVELDPVDRSIVVGSASVTVERLLPVLSEYFGFDVAKRLS